MRCGSLWDVLRWRRRLAFGRGKPAQRRGGRTMLPDSCAAGPCGSLSPRRDARAARRGGRLLPSEPAVHGVRGAAAGGSEGLQCAREVGDVCWDDTRLHTSAAFGHRGRGCAAARARPSRAMDDGGSATATAASRDASVGQDGPRDKGQAGQQPSQRPAQRFARVA